MTSGDLINKATSVSYPICVKHALFALFKIKESSQTGFRMMFLISFR